MHTRKFINIFIALCLLMSFLQGSVAKVGAAPASPVDETKVPHYYGPYPNWANSQFTLPDATVVIADSLLVGTGAEAVATVGANGEVIALEMINPGSGYTQANISVNIVGAGNGATASVTVADAGAVSSVAVTNGGSGYTAPTVAFSNVGQTVTAVATAYGSVTGVAVDAGGSGYTFPTVEFDMPDDPEGVKATAHAVWDGNGTITDIVIDNPGSGYAVAPNVVIYDGSIFDPQIGGTGALASAALSIDYVLVEDPGDGYPSTPTVTINDPTGAGAEATAQVLVGTVTGITLLTGGSGYITPNGIKKFTDPLPNICIPPACPATGKYIPIGVAETKDYNGVEADEYVIGLVQYKTSFSSSLPPTLVRGYVQLETAANAGISQHFPLVNEFLNKPAEPIYKSDGITQWLAVTPPQWLGPTILATKDKPVRIVFYNLLPDGADGDLFLPVDTTMMGSGHGLMEEGYDPTPTTGGTVMDDVRNPMCTDKYYDPMMRDMCFTENRATLHLHGGISPWISDGTPHQWITPADEMTAWPEGVSVQNVPDMNVCNAADDGCQTFYYTNQQSARLLFYHDHSWGITRLNVYAGEAAGYLIGDATENALIAAGRIPGLADTIPLVVQDRTFVPDAAQLAWQDPTWDATRWGGMGNFWYHHVYMPAQNPGDPGGMSGYGRWMYGAWFWPPQTDLKYGPIPNPYYNRDPDGPNDIRGDADDWTTVLECHLDDPLTWQYDIEPFCEPEQIPGTPLISAGMEQFNDTPIVNGVAYPTLTVQPKLYRLRILSAANDRFFNFQWYVGDPNTASTSMNNLPVPEVIGPTEVLLNPDEVAAAQIDPVVFPTPVQNTATAGPDWVQIGTEGGFLPFPAVIDGQQPTTWIQDATRFDVGNVDQHSLLLAPAERADVLVDFSRFAGKTLILYNDAPAAFPARIPSYDYYTGAPDLTPVGAPKILPGYGPNTRTIMQVKVANTTPATRFDLPGTSNDGLGRLQAAFRHNAAGTGVFESGQHPIIVGQSAYNSAYGTSFAASSNCNAPGSTQTRCDGLLRISDTSTFGFNTLRTPNAKMSLHVEPKAIHDETNATTFDEFGRMQANLGLTSQPPTPGLINANLMPFVYPPTEIIDGSKLPVANTNGIKILPIATADDGTQIWRITHNGVDTHPIHFHLYDVQMLNRVTWDNTIIPNDPNEMGWKDTIRVAPLEDTIVALRPIIPILPFEIPNSVRKLDPMKPLWNGTYNPAGGNEASIGDVGVIGSALVGEALGVGIPPAAPNGEPIDILNHVINFGWEYVYHCHILSHEEMDMMRPVILAVPPRSPDGLVAQFISVPNTAGAIRLTWTDNTITDTSYGIERRDNGGAWAQIATVDTPLDQPNTTGVRTFDDTTIHASGTYEYRVVALNTVGDTWNYATQNNELVSGGFPTVTVKSAYSNVSNAIVVPVGPNAPTDLAGALNSGPRVRLTWTDNSTNETGFQIEQSVNGGAYQVAASAPSAQGTGSRFYNLYGVTPGANYIFRIAAVRNGVLSDYSNEFAISIPAAPAAPSNVTVVNVTVSGGVRTIRVSWVDNAANETGYTVQVATDAAFTNIAATYTYAANTVQRNITNLNPNTQYYVRVWANNGPYIFSTAVNAAPFPITTLP